VYVLQSIVTPDFSFTAVDTLVPDCLDSLSAIRDKIIAPFFYSSTLLHSQSVTDSNNESLVTVASDDSNVKVPA
jgi:hypothetical protein